MKKILIILGIGYFLLFSVHNVFALWQGPYEVVKGSWGTDIGQFGFVHGDPNDGFPTKFLIDKYDNIIIADFYNKRVQIIFTNGEVTEFSYKDLNPGWEILQWPSDRIGVYDHMFVEGGFGKFQYYDYQGNLIMQFDVPDSILRMVGSDGSLILQNYKTDKYFKYSPTSHLLETYNEKPLELGIVNEKSLGNGSYKVTIKYPDMSYILNKGPYSEYSRFCKEAIYAISGKSVEKFGANGELLGELVIPDDQRKIIRPGGGGFEEVSEVLAEYGTPLVSLSGDIYTWKRTPDKYSIIKWVWVDDLDSPLNLKAEASEKNISLTWTRPKEDSDKVTGYEIDRSTEVCGPFEEIGEVKKDVLNYIDKDIKAGDVFYYKVRAIKDKVYSGYSNKVVGNLK